MMSCQMAGSMHKTGRPPRGVLSAVRHWTGCRPPTRLQGIREAADMAGWPQDGHRCSSSRRWTAQANTIGSRHVLRQAPPCWSWMGLPSPARHCGQYMLAVSAGVSLVVRAKRNRSSSIRSKRRSVWVASS